jgi:hypothetical protein
MRECRTTAPTVFNEVVRQGWLTHNVADRMNLTTRRRDEVRIYSLADCEERLRNAMSGDRTTAPFASIGLFCGLAAGERTSEPALVGR